MVEKRTMVLAVPRNKTSNTLLSSVPGMPRGARLNAILCQKGTAAGDFNVYLGNGTEVILVAGNTATVTSAVYLGTEGIPIGGPDLDLYYKTGTLAGAWAWVVVTSTDSDV